MDLHPGARTLAGPRAERHVARGRRHARAPARHDGRGPLPVEGPDPPPRGPRRRALLRRRGAPVRAHALDAPRDRREPRLPEGRRAPGPPLPARAAGPEGAPRRDRLRAGLAPRAQAGREPARRGRDRGAPPRARRAHAEPGAPGGRARRDRGRRAHAGRRPEHPRLEGGGARLRGRARVLPRRGQRLRARRLRAAQGLARARARRLQRGGARAGPDAAARHPAGRRAGLRQVARREVDGAAHGACRC